jgi:hypothetical protein
MSKPVGNPVASLIDAARGNTEVVKSAVDALRELAKQPYKSDAPATNEPASRAPARSQP